MNRRDRVRRQWTHRRLGLGAATPSEAAIDHTDALLTAVGARRTSGSGLAVDAFTAALLDFVCDLDLAAGVPEIDATPIPLAALRAQATSSRHRRVRWRLLVPAVSGGFASLALGLALVLADGSAPSNAPALAATTQSKQLLSHADMLLTAASQAARADRPKLVEEARADLTHVTRLLPLTAPQSQPEIRAQLRLLDKRVQPLTTKRHHPSAGDADEEASGSFDDTAQRAPTGSSGSAVPTSGSRGGSGAEAPVRRQPPVRRPSGASVTTGSGAGGTSYPPPTADDQTSGGTTPTQYATGSQPRPVSDTSPRPQGGMQGTTYQQPPPGGFPFRQP